MQAGWHQNLTTILLRLGERLGECTKTSKSCEMHTSARWVCAGSPPRTAQVRLARMDLA